MDLESHEIQLQLSAKADCLYPNTLLQGRPATPERVVLTILSNHISSQTEVLINKACR